MVTQSIGTQLNAIALCLLVTALLGTHSLLLGCQDNTNANSNDSTAPAKAKLVEGEKVTIAIGDMRTTYRTAKIAVGKKHFQMKLAITTETRIRGLGKMTEKQIGQGMLFAFPNAQIRSFVMRDCPKPIDIVFVNPDGLITAIHKMQPEKENTEEYNLKSYSSKWVSVIALEFIGGTLDTLDLKVGQKLNLPLDDLKRIAK
jgi:uncharacterized membrane protein (UPF0127 family)